MDAWMDVSIDAYMDGWMDGWMHACMQCMDGRMDGPDQARPSDSSVPAPVGEPGLVGTLIGGPVGRPSPLKHSKKK